MHLKSVKYACKYALKTPKCALKNPKISTTNIKTIKNKNIFSQRSNFFTNVHANKTFFRPVRWLKICS